MTVVDTSQTVRIAAARREAAIALACGLGFVALGLFFILGGIEGTRRYPAWMFPVVGWLSVLFFGPLSLGVLWSVFTTPRKPLVVAPDGLTDRRVSPDRIGWSEIVALKTARAAGRRFVRVVLTRAAQSKVQITLFARLVRWLNRRAYGDGLWINAHGVAIGEAELEALLTAYWRAHGDPAIVGKAAP